MICASARVSADLEAELEAETHLEMLGADEPSKVVHGAFELVKGESWRERDLATSCLDGSARVGMVSRAFHGDGGVDGRAEAVGEYRKRLRVKDTIQRHSQRGLLNDSGAALRLHRVLDVALQQTISDVGERSRVITHHVRMCVLEQVERVKGVRKGKKKKRKGVGVWREEVA